MSALARAFDAWSAELGARHVVVDRESLAAAQTATFATSRRVVGIVRPGTREEVQACLRVADAHRVPVYPVSRGKNWGLGSRVPSADGCALLDLSRMDRIVGHDEELGYVTVEPGVTFRQLASYLEEHTPGLMLSQTGSTPDSSLIGNTVERGTGRGLYEDRWRHVGAFEVVLPTGELVHTGFGRFATCRVAEVSDTGVGPSLRGLFTQSNLGVVTRMTIWLAPRPRYFQTFLFQVSDPDRLPEVVDALRRARMEGGLRGVFSLYNDLRILSLLRQYPWRRSGGATPLSEELRAELRSDSGIALWNGSGALFSASRAHGRAERRLLGRVLRGRVSRLLILDPLKVALARRISGLVRRVTGFDLAERLDKVYTRSAYLGYQDDAGGTPLTYWRKRTPVPDDPDPDRDRCGTIWLNPRLPWRGGDLADAADLLSAMSVEHGFEPNLGFRFLGERTVDLTGALVYDRGVPGEDERAMACHDAMLRELARRGYLPSRLGIQSMDSLPTPGDDTPLLLGRLKSALDPRGILAPGRYLDGCPRRSTNPRPERTDARTR